MLEIQELDLFYDDAQALADISLKVEAKEIVAIIGANGAGKSSLIRAIAGIEKIAKGSIQFKNEEISGLESHHVCNRGIGQVAEGRQIFPSMSVLENLEMGAVIPRGRAKEKQTLEQVFSMFPRLAERKKQHAGTLSGGEQQMLAIGRCLMGQPELIMFDEPSMGLSPRLVQELFEVIEQLNAHGMTILLVEQNVAVSLKMATHAYVLENGQITLSGSGNDLLHNEQVRQAYLGM